MPAERVHTPTTRAVGNDYADPRGTKRVHDPELLPEKLRVRKPKFIKYGEHISAGVLNYGSESLDAGSEDIISVTTKAEENQELRIKRTMISHGEIKLCLIRSDYNPKPTSVDGIASKTKKVRTVKLQVYRDDAVENRRSKRYDPQTRKSTLVKPVATVAFGVELERDSRDANTLQLL
ncbi:hypothetical protein MMC17_002259 [Xylographa soralifera]|nr:hypothetical protein [Xylographa soralifera]